MFDSDMRVDVNVKSRAKKIFFSRGARSSRAKIGRARRPRAARARKIGALRSRRAADERR
jgi:hypothetical protein